jgi:hypothetical protein
MDIQHKMAFELPEINEAEELADFPLEFTWKERFASKGRRPRRHAGGLARTSTNDDLP